MNNLIIKIFLILILIIFTQGCSTAMTVVDTATSVTVNTVKGVLVHLKKKNVFKLI